MFPFRGRGGFHRGGNFPPNHMGGPGFGGPRMGYQNHGFRGGPFRGGGPPHNRGGGGPNMHNRGGGGPNMHNRGGGGGGWGRGRGGFNQGHFGGKAEEDQRPPFHSQSSQPPVAGPSKEPISSLQTGSQEPPRGPQDSTKPEKWIRAPALPCEDEPEFDENLCLLDWSNSDLNLIISKEDFCSVKAMSHEGFGYMWAGVRATHGANRGKVCYEVKIDGNQPTDHLEKEQFPNVLRVGWSVHGSNLQLGEVKFSYGYGGTAKIADNCSFRNYGKMFGVGDVLGCYLDSSGDNITMKYTLNGQDLGVAFRVNRRELGNKALFPHILTKNQDFTVNFGQMDAPLFPLLPGYTPIGQLDSKDGLVRSPLPIPSRSECEVLMMVGLPGAGKTYWAEKFAKENPDKNYNILGTNNLIEKMKVNGLSRKRNYHGRWEVLIEKCTKSFNKILEIAAKRRRNYILDQTNVFPTARGRKMKDFQGFKHKAVVVVPTDDEFRRRVAERESVEGKEVPDNAVLNMKANFVLPDVEESFLDIWYTELGPEEANKQVHIYNEAARSGGFITTHGVRAFKMRNENMRRQKNLPLPGKHIGQASAAGPSAVKIESGPGQSSTPAGPGAMKSEPGKPPFMNKTPYPPGNVKPPIPGASGKPGPPTNSFNQGQARNAINNSKPSLSSSSANNSSGYSSSPSVKTEPGQSSASNRHSDSSKPRDSDKRKFDDSRSRSRDRKSRRYDSPQRRRSRSGDRSRRRSRSPGNRGRRSWSRDRDRNRRRSRSRDRGSSNRPRKDNASGSSYRDSPGGSGSNSRHAEDSGHRGGDARKHQEPAGGTGSRFSAAPPGQGESPSDSWGGRGRGAGPPTRGRGYFRGGRGYGGDGFQGQGHQGDTGADEAMSGKPPMGGRGGNSGFDSRGGGRGRGFRGGWAGNDYNRSGMSGEQNADWKESGYSDNYGDSGHFGGNSYGNQRSEDNRQSSFNARNNTGGYGGNDFNKGGPQHDSYTDDYDDYSQSGNRGNFDRDIDDEFAARMSRDYGDEDEDYGQSQGGYDKGNQSYGGRGSGRPGYGGGRGGYGGSSRGGYHAGGGYQDGGSSRYEGSGQFSGNGNQPGPGHQDHMNVPPPPISQHSSGFGQDLHGKSAHGHLASSSAAYVAGVTTSSAVATSQPSISVPVVIPGAQGPLLATTQLIPGQHPGLGLVASPSGMLAAAPAGVLAPGSLASLENIMGKGNVMGLTGNMLGNIAGLGVIGTQGLAGLVGSAGNVLSGQGQQAGMMGGMAAHQQAGMGHVAGFAGQQGTPGVMGGMMMGMPGGQYHAAHGGQSGNFMMPDMSQKPPSASATSAAASENAASSASAYTSGGHQYYGQADRQGNPAETAAASTNPQVAYQTGHGTSGRYGAPPGVGAGSSHGMLTAGAADQNSGGKRDSWGEGGYSTTKDRDRQSSQADADPKKSGGRGAYGGIAGQQPPPVGIVGGQQEQSSVGQAPSAGGIEFGNKGPVGASRSSRLNVDSSRIPGVNPPAPDPSAGAGAAAAAAAAGAPQAGTPDYAALLQYLQYYQKQMGTEDAAGGK